MERKAREVLFTRSDALNYDTSVFILQHELRLRSTLINLANSHWGKIMADKLSLTVTGMKCGGCETSVKTKLEALDGVSAVVASHQQKTVELEFEPEKINQDTIIKTIIEAGYKVG